MRLPGLRCLFAVAIHLLLTCSLSAQSGSSLVGVWSADEGFQVVEYLFRSDGRYQVDKRSADPELPFSSTDRGRYTFDGAELVLSPYDFFGEPARERYGVELLGGVLTLVRDDLPPKVLQFRDGSREEVLARERVSPVLVGVWSREVVFFGTEAFTFRPGGYYFIQRTHQDSQFPPEFIRGRYEQADRQLTLRPYGGTEVRRELDFFGDTLTVIESDAFSARSLAFEKVSGSEAEVRARHAEAEAFLAREDWLVGVWEVRDAPRNLDLTFRPDGHYRVENHGEFLRGVVRGRYTLEPRRIHLMPHVGQGIYSPDNGEFGKVERTRVLDYYDGELQFIDAESFFPSVTLARKRAGSEGPVTEKTRQALVERQRAGWQVGVWEVKDPAGWMEFTLRPDFRYIAKSGSAVGAPGQVERGRYVLRGGKLTLAPYSGQGPARGFEIDLHDGDFLMAGDLNRLVLGRKIAGSEAEVIEKTVNPVAARGERGGILGRWTARRPGEFVELVFRPDGEFRLSRCRGGALSKDYGLYTADMAAGEVVYDSRFVPVQGLGIDFYGDTLTLHGGHGAPSTYTVNLGTVDAAIEASHAADILEEQEDAGWRARVPIGPRDPDAVQLPAGDIPADPNPGRVFPDPTVLTGYRLYRRLILGQVFFNVMGSIRSLDVVNTREWHFFPNGRVLVRFKNHHASPVYPVTLADVSDSWGAYHVGPRPTERDILQLFADNSLTLETDAGERVEMTLEDGRRHLFWGKDYQILSEWASEQKPVPCEMPAEDDASLVNTGIALATQIVPDEAGAPQPLRIRVGRGVAGALTLSGTNLVAGRLTVERSTGEGRPWVWEAVSDHELPAGPFILQVAMPAQDCGFFRVRGP